MVDRQVSLQDHFLNSVRRAKAPVTIFLVKGVKLQGNITWFDAFSLLLRREGASQLIYKHAVSTIAPQQPLAGFELPGSDRDECPRAGLQDLFLATVRREQEPLTVFLINGVMLTGTVSGFDQFSLLLERSGQLQLVYKHAISTLQPGKSLRLSPAGEDDGEGANR